MVQIVYIFQQHCEMNTQITENEFIVNFVRIKLYQWCPSVDQEETTRYR